jgi:hypothetical protein
MFASLKLASRPAISIDFTGVILDDRHSCNKIRDFLKSSCEEVHRIVFRDNEINSSNEACQKLVEEVGNLSFKDVFFASEDDELLEVMIGNASRMKMLQRLTIWMETVMRRFDGPFEPLSSRFAELNNLTYLVLSGITSIELHKRN